MSAAKQKIRVGISSCLLGENVRWDGGHKLDSCITTALGPFFEWVPTCPELEAGLGVPREPMHLARQGNTVRVMGRESNRDWTPVLERYNRTRLNELARLDLCGYIFKKNSPSCGLKGVTLYTDRGTAAGGKGTGLFAAALGERFSGIPAEEEDRLNDPAVREHFIVRVFAFHRLRRLFRSGYSRGALVAFHTASKFLLLAHSRKHYTELGRLVAGAAAHRPAGLRDRYTRIYLEGLARRSTPKKNADVLLHMMGFLKRLLGPDDKREILTAIEDYRRERVPLAVPLTLVRRYVRRFDIQYLAGQLYLNPHSNKLSPGNPV
ncbi:MAG: hypothetical protein COV67_02060 [Nitrospinae bacterium CG11_big_fil_rev_8_21_14_0_20_56_8]|nr:MAG: hypothetical protein COV67_02060 [Nitrospinae bacterium CG11_big_fil_rev_8_21_14_0_20_56_8]